MNEKINEQAQMLANRLQKRFRHLKKWAKRSGVEAFRLYDRDIPEIPLVLDFYGDCSELQDAVLSGALYKRPYEKDEAEEEQWLSAMKESTALALGVKLENVFLKQREKQRGVSQYEKFNSKKDVRAEKIVNENELKFKVNLSDYLDTGLFIDRRILRAMVRDAAKGKKVLNLFSYTGSFSVYAAAGGAASTDSVDLSNTYLNWAKENFELNGYSVEFQKTSHEDTSNHRFAAQRTQRKESEVIIHRLIRADVLEYIDRAFKEKMHWDIIIVDPPAFSNSKKMTDNFDLNRDLIELLAQCLKLLSSGGEIFLSVNLHRKAPNAQELETALKNMDSAALQVIDLKNKIIDEDFKDRKIPSAFLVRR